MASTVLAIQRLPVFTAAEFKIKNNADWRDAIAFRDGSLDGPALNIAPITFRAHLRETAGSPVLAGGDLEMSTTNGLLLNGGASGVLGWAVPRERMMNVKPGIYVMDIEARQSIYWLNLFPDQPATVIVSQGITR